MRGVRGGDGGEVNNLDEDPTLHANHRHIRSSVSSTKSFPDEARFILHSPGKSKQANAEQSSAVLKTEAHTHLLPGLHQTANVIARSIASVWHAHTFCKLVP